MGRKLKIPERIYTFIDYDDVVEKHGRLHYRAKCPDCRADRGYKRPNKFNARCLDCQTKKMRTSITQESRKKHSEAMKGRKAWNRSSCSDAQRKIRRNLSSLMSKRLRKRQTNSNYKTKFNGLGYTIEELMKHLELQFSQGMTWDNYGEWEIDHKTPDTWFSYSSIEDSDFKKCWALNNLQPLWAKDNCSKGNRYRN